MKNKVKVRIKKFSSDNIKPLYEQDRTLALKNYVYPVMSDKKKEPEERIQNTEIEVPESQANAEVERGEVIYNPNNEQLTKVLGKKHSQGGTMVDLDAGSFIFSDHLKLSDGEKEFLDTKGKNPSYADAVAKFIKPFNKATHTLNTSDDKIEKETAALSIDNVKQRLSKVAFLQEGSKGFKDGIPNIAQNTIENMATEAPDTLNFLQEGGFGINLGTKLNKSDWEKKVKSEGYIPVPGTRYARKDSKSSTYTPGKVTPVLNRNKDNKGHIKNLISSGKSYEEALAKGDINDNPQWRLEWQRQNGKFDSKNKSDFIYYDEDQIAQSSSPNPQKKPINNPSVSPNNPGATYEKPFTDTGYGFMDAVSMSAPFLNKINRYAPIRVNIDPQQQNFRPVDYTAQRQAAFGQARSMAEVSDITSPTSSVASARRSSIFAQTLDPANQSFMQEFNTNQLGYQQVDAQNAAARQQADTFNAGQDDLYNTRYAQMNENFDARKSQRTSQFLNSWNVAEKQRQARNLYNYLNQDFQIGPNQEIYRIPYSTDQMMARLTGQTNTSEPSNIFERIKSLKEQARTYGVDLSTDQAMSLMKNAKGDSYTETDKNNDGVIDSTSRRTNNPSFNNLLSMFFQ